LLQFEGIFQNILAKEYIQLYIYVSPSPNNVFPSFLQLLIGEKILILHLIAEVYTLLPKINRKSPQYQNYDLKVYSNADIGDGTSFAISSPCLLSLPITFLCALLLAITNPIASLLGTASVCLRCC
jgi:hypothetical protein